MPTYAIRLVCEAGPELLTGETLPHAEETLMVDAPTPWAGRTRAIAEMTLSARGRLLRAYDAETGLEIAPPAAESLRSGLFDIDGLPGTYQGFTRGTLGGCYPPPGAEKSAKLI